jgi:hypothetical protein
MKKRRKKNEIKEDWEIVETRGAVTLKHGDPDYRVFDVECQLGKFRVMDYSYKPLDREIFWLPDITPVRNSTEEYKTAAILVNGYVQVIHDKLPDKEKKKWPLAE